MSTLEKRAMWGLIIGVVWAVVFFTVFFTLGGIETYSESFKSIKTAIVVIGAVFFIIMDTSYRRCAKADERDKLILMRASGMVLTATILTVGAWCVALQLIYNEQLATGYLYLIIISMAIVGMIMQAAGILFWSRHNEYLDKV